MPLKTHLAQWPRVILNSNLSFLQIKLHTKNLELLDKIYKKKILETVLFHILFRMIRRVWSGDFREKKTSEGSKLSENFEMIKLGKVIRL